MTGSVSAPTAVPGSAFRADLFRRRQYLVEVTPPPRRASPVRMCRWPSPNPARFRPDRAPASQSRCASSRSAQGSSAQAPYRSIAHVGCRASDTRIDRGSIATVGRAVRPILSGIHVSSCRRLQGDRLGILKGFGGTCGSLVQQRGTPTGRLELPALVQSLPSVGQRNVELGTNISACR